MGDIEFALHQGPACALAGLKKRWPGLEVRVESMIVFPNGPLFETARIEGSLTAQALDGLKDSMKDKVQVLEQDVGHARVRLQVSACPLSPLVLTGSLRPCVPFCVELDSDRWVFEDEPKQVEEALRALKTAGLMPKMVRRDPKRRR